MSKIEERLKALKEQEERLRQEGLKIQFLQHILDEAKASKLEQFKRVKAPVIEMLEDFVENAIESIEKEQPLIMTVGSPIPSPEHLEESKKHIVPEEGSSKPKPPEQKKPLKQQEPGELSPQEKLNFAMEHRHLSGKTVKVSNPKDPNLPFSGEITGLDAPFVIVKTEQGPIIKVPLEKVIL